MKTVTKIKIRRVINRRSNGGCRTIRKDDYSSPDLD